jgi:hypothetical protein
MAQRKLVVNLFSNISDYSCLLREDEKKTLDQLRKTEESINGLSENSMVDG